MLIRKMWLWEKVVGHKLLDTIMPPYLHDVKRLKHNHQLIENFTSGLSNHVMGHGSSKLVLAKDIVYTFVASQLKGSNWEATKVLGVDKKKQFFLMWKNAFFGHIKKCFLDILQAGNKIKCLVSTLCWIYHGLVDI